MSKWREIVESELNKIGFSLYESSTIKFSIDELANTLLYFDAVDTGLRYLYVYKNPSSIEIDNILQNCEEKELRGLAIDNDFYVWDAYFCIHTEMLNLLKERIHIDSNSYIGDFVYNGKLEAGYIQKGNDNNIRDIDLLKKILLNNKHFLHTFGENEIYNISPHQDWELEDLDENTLKEAKQVGLLYHGVASLSDLIKILETDSLWHNRDIGISTSRQLKNDYTTGIYSRPAILVLDGDKLSENFKILPFQYPYEPNNHESIIQTNKRYYYKKHYPEYPLSINNYLNWINELYNNEDNEGNYSNGGELKNLHNYLIKIILNKEKIEKDINEDKKYYSKKQIEKELNKIYEISTVPIELKNI